MRRAFLEVKREERKEKEERQEREEEEEEQATHSFHQKTNFSLSLSTRPLSFSFLQQQGWGAVIAKTVSLDASKVVNVTPRYSKVKEGGSFVLFSFSFHDLDGTKKRKKKTQKTSSS